MHRAHLKRWLGAALATVGALPLLYLCSLLAWQYGSRLETGKWIALPASLAFADKVPLPYLPKLPAAWLAQTEAWPPVHLALTSVLAWLHIGLVFAVIGVVLMAFGVLMVWKQNELLRIEEQARADRLRRVQLRQYGEYERREPFIGPGIPANHSDRREAA